MASRGRETPEGLCRSLFDRANDPGAWLNTADGLKRAAELIRRHGWANARADDAVSAIEEDTTIGPAYMLLMGFGIENLLKGLIIARHPDYAEPPRLDRRIITHDLNKLWKLAQIQPCDVHSLMLTRLTAIIESFGRYPVTLTKDKMVSLFGTQFHADTDFEDLDRLWRTLRRRFEKQMDSDSMDETPTA